MREGPQFQSNRKHPGKGSHPPCAMTHFLSEEPAVLTASDRRRWSRYGPIALEHCGNHSPCSASSLCS